MTEPVPDKAMAPANLLAEELEYRGLRAEDLAPQMGWSVADVEALIAGRTPITTEAAAALEHALGIDADLWINLQQAYEVDLARLAPPP